MPLSEVKLSLLLNLERQSSFLGTWKAEGAPGGGARAVLGEGRRSPWAAALRSTLPGPPASSLDCDTKQHKVNCNYIVEHGAEMASRQRYATGGGRGVVLECGRRSLRNKHCNKQCLLLFCRLLRVHT